MCWTVDSVQTIVSLHVANITFLETQSKFWQSDFMKSTIQSNFASALLTVSLAIAINPVGAFAQGSAGGSIGNDDKAVSGSRQDREKPAARERGARRSKPEAEEPRRASRKSGGGGNGGGNFDGEWVLTSVGTPCGSSTDTVVITSGRMVGQYGTAQVSPNGSTSGIGAAGSLTWSMSGRLSGRGGSGSFRRSDGCVGSWTGSKQ
jgi:hypothetical protein